MVMKPADVKLPALWLDGNKNANKGGLRCLRCGKPVRGNAVQMFRDWRVDEFHDFGGIPDRDHGAPNPYPDGPYEVGPDCAKAWRQRACFALSRAGFAVPVDGETV